MNIHKTLSGKCRFQHLRAARPLLLLLVHLSCMLGVSGAPRRILFYGPCIGTQTWDGGDAETIFINDHSTGASPEFAPMGATDLSASATTSQVWDEQTWINASTADFKKFDALVFTDTGNFSPQWSAAIQTRAIWGGAINGNIITVGGDPQNDGRPRVWRQGIRYSAQQPGASHTRTGLYLALDHSSFGESLSGSVEAPTEIPILSWFGSFTAVEDDWKYMRMVTDHPLLNPLGPDVNGSLDSSAISNWGLQRGFHSWPSGFYPLAYSYDVSNPTPIATFVPNLEADTGYHHPEHLRARAGILAKSADSFTLKFLTCGTPNLGQAVGGTVGLNISSYYREDPTGAIYRPTQAITWRVISGPNVGNGGGFTQVSGTANWTANFTSTHGAGQDIVRVFYDYDGDHAFDDFDGNNNGLGDPTTPCDFGITLTVNWGTTRVSIATTDATSTEAPGNTANFRISRTGGSNTSALPVAIASPVADAIGFALVDNDYGLTVGGNAVSTEATIPAGASYVDVLLTPIQDGNPEGTEIAKLSLVDSDTGTYAVSGNGYATASITDDDQPTVTISSATASGGAPTAAENSATPGVWVVSRATAEAVDLDVFFTVSGTATREVDYNLGGAVSLLDENSVPYAYPRVTIPAGFSSATVTLVTLQDSRTEGTESATLTLRSTPAYKLGSPSTASVNITDDDSPKLPTSYTIVEIPSSYDAYAINDSAPPSVVGSFLSTAGTQHAYRYQNAVLTDLGAIQKTTLPGSLHYSYAYGINTPSSGTPTIVGSGFSWNSVQTYLPYYYRWSGSFTELSVPGSLDLYQAGPMSVNNAGWIVGFTRSSSGYFRSAKWNSSGTWTDLGTLGAAPNAVSYAWAVGQAGNGNRVVGQSQFDLVDVGASTGSYHAFRTQSSGAGPQPIANSDDLGNALASETSQSGAYAVNALGEIAGFSSYSGTQVRAAYKDGNSGKHKGWRMLGVLSGGAGDGNAAQALGLNDLGLIVGWSRTTSTGSRHAVAWENHQTPTATDLNTKLPAGDQAEWVLENATAINQAGYIAGYGKKNGSARGFLLTPVP